VPLCSGVMWPQSGASIEARGAFSHAPAEWCPNTKGQDWREACHMAVEKPMRRY
jgi:hypothetical protein